MPARAAHYKSPLVPGKVYRGIVLAVDPYTCAVDSKVTLVIQVDRNQFPSGEIKTSLVDESRVEVTVIDAN